MIATTAISSKIKKSAVLNIMRDYLRDIQKATDLYNSVFDVDPGSLIIKQSFISYFATKLSIKFVEELSEEFVADLWYNDFYDGMNHPITIAQLSEIDITSMRQMVGTTPAGNPPATRHMSTYDLNNI